MKKILLPILGLIGICSANAQTISVIPGSAAFATKSGSTNIVGTISGTLTNGHCVSIDGNMNLVDAGGACTTGGGGGTVSSGTINQLGVYASTGTTISGLATANSGVLVTSGAGVPSISSTLPNGLALGTPGSVTLTNGTGLPISGITGLGTGVGTALAAAVSGSGGICLTTNCVLITPTLGVASATTINKVTITAPASGSTLTIADGKTLTDTSGVGAKLLLGATGGGFSGYAGASCTNQFLRSLDTAGAGTCATVGSNDLASSLSLTTPSLGVATATSINKVAITAPATSATLTIANGKTLTASNTLTFTGTDSSSIAFGSGGVIGAVGYAAQGNIPGDTAGSNPTAGNIGHSASSTVLAGSAVSLTNNTPADVTSLAVPAGSQMICGSVFFVANAATTITQLISWTSSSSATFPTAPNSGSEAVQWSGGTLTGSAVGGPVGCQIVRVGSPTTYYLSTRALFAVNTLTAYGFISYQTIN